MSLCDPTPRRKLPVRLSDIPREVRMEAARQCCRRARDRSEREALVSAAAFPSRTVYFVEASAAPMVRAWAA